MTALAHSLQLRGHEVAIFGIADTEEGVRAAGIEFHRIGAEDYPPGTLKRLDEQLARLKGIAAFRFTLERVRNSTRMVLRDGPEAVRTANVGALLVDEAEFAGNVADHLGLPWISIALIPPLLRDDRFPPFWLGWAAGQDRLSRLRNRLAIHLLLRIATPIFREVNQRRSAWGLKPHPRPEDGVIASGAKSLSCLKHWSSKSAAKSQPGFTIPGRSYTLNSVLPSTFPGTASTDAPLIYASLGTLQNGSEAIFRTITDACAGLGAQLLISLGGGLDPARLGKLAGDPLVVRVCSPTGDSEAGRAGDHACRPKHGPRVASEGVPLVAVPLGNDQPGVGGGLKARGACVVVSRHRLNPARLRKAVMLVLQDARYREAAQVLQRAIQQLDGPDRAADLIEQVLKLRSTQPLA